MVIRAGVAQRESILGSSSDLSPVLAEGQGRWPLLLLSFFGCMVSPHGPQARGVSPTGPASGRGGSWSVSFSLLLCLVSCLVKPDAQSLASAMSLWGSRPFWPPPGRCRRGQARRLSSWQTPALVPECRP